MWGDGLSCERVVGAQNACANGNTTLEQLTSLESAPQDWHKRLLYVEVNIKAFLYSSISLLLLQSPKINDCPLKIPGYYDHAL